VPLLNVPGTVSGDSLPAELRSGVKEWRGTALMPSLRLSAGQAGLCGRSTWYAPLHQPASIWYGGVRGLGVSGLNGLGQAMICPDPTDSSSCFPAGQTDTGVLGCQPDDTGGLVPGQVYCSTNSIMTAAQVAQAQAQSSNIGKGGVGPVQSPSSTATTTSVLSALNQMLATQQRLGSQVTPGGTIVLPPGSAGSIATTGGGASNVAVTGTANLFTGTSGMILMLGAGLLLIMLMQRGGK
jgi:hypothetical protein